MKTYTTEQADMYRTLTLAEIIAQLAPVASEAEAVASWSKNEWEKSFAAQMAATMRRGQFLSPKQMDTYLRISRKWQRAV